MYYLLGALSFYLVWVISMGFVPNVVLRDVPDNLDCIGDLRDTLTPTENLVGCDNSVLKTVPLEFYVEALNAAHAYEIDSQTGMRSAKTSNDAEVILGSGLDSVLLLLSADHNCRGGFGIPSDISFENPVNTREDCIAAATAWNRYFEPTDHAGENNVQKYCVIDQNGTFAFDFFNFQNQIVTQCQKFTTRSDMSKIVDQVEQVLNQPGFDVFVASTENFKTGDRYAFPGLSTYQIEGIDLGVWPTDLEKYFVAGFTNTSVLVKRFSKHKRDFAKILEIYAHGTLPGGLQLSDRYVSLWYRMSSSSTEWFSCFDPLFTESDLSDVVDVLGGQQCYRKNVNECEVLRGLHVSSIVALIVAVGLTVASTFLPSFKSKAIALVIAVLVMFASLTPIATIVIERERALAPFFDVNFIVSFFSGFLSVSNLNIDDIEQIKPLLASPDSNCGYSWPILIERLALRLGEDFAASRPSEYDILSRDLLTETSKFLGSLFTGERADLQTTNYIGNLFETVGYDVQYGWGFYLHGVTIAVGTLIWATILFFTFRTSAKAFI